jgi:hypothetical protein
MLDLAHGQVLRALDATELPLLQFAHVQEHRRIGLLQHLLQLMHGYSSHS